MIKRFFAIAAALWLGLALSPAPALAAPNPNIQQSVAVCDPWFPTVCQAGSAFSVSGSATGAGNLSNMPVKVAQRGVNAFSVQWTAVGAGNSATYEGSNDGASWFNLSCVAEPGGAQASTFSLSTALPVLCSTNGYSQARVRISTYISGTPSASVNFFGSSVVPGLVQPTGAFQISISTSPALTAASAYASGNTLGGINTLASAVRSNNGTSILQKVVLNFKSSQTAQTDLILFDSTPSGSTVTDKTALSIATTDSSKVIGIVHIADCTNIGTPSTCQATNLALPIRTSGSTSIFGVFVTRGTPTFTSTSDLTAILQFLQD